MPPKTKRRRKVQGGIENGSSSVTQNDQQPTPSAHQKRLTATQALAKLQEILDTESGNDSDDSEDEVLLDDGDVPLCEVDSSSSSDSDNSDAEHTADEDNIQNPIVVRNVLFLLRFLSETPPGGVFA